MSHPFERGGDRNFRRTTGWETLDIEAMARGLEVGQDSLRKLLTGAFRPSELQAIAERDRVVALVGLVLGMDVAEVERRIDLSRTLRERRRADKSGSIGATGYGRRSSISTD